MPPEVVAGWPAEQVPALELLSLPGGSGLARESVPEGTQVDAYYTGFEEDASREGS